jgi:hypothetical protein
MEDTQVPTSSVYQPDNGGNRVTMDLPPHLGGHQGVTHVDEGTLLYLRDKLKVSSMIDIGCGPGGQVMLAQSMGIDSVGLDGDFQLEYPEGIEVILQDLTKGTGEITPVDLAWCVEFLEHIDEEYLYNVFDIFRQCDLVFCTHAPPGKDGVHHVNCQSEEYWIRLFNQNGFSYDIESTRELRKVSTMKREFVRETGKLFVRRTR